LHAVFAEIRERHPGLVVDVCAGGGRKIDLDIMSLSIQKWQSDFTSKGASDNLQGHLMGEQHYQPLSAAGIWSNNPYTWRSVATTGGLIFFDQRNSTEAERSLTAAALAETKRLRPLVIEGDFFVLSNLDAFGRSNMSSAPTGWAAWQWAAGCGRAPSPSSGAEHGAVLLFRRLKASASTLVALNCVDPVATGDRTSPVT
jgi:alpha-galactosidase